MNRLLPFVLAFSAAGAACSSSSSSGSAETGTDAGPDALATTADSSSGSAETGTDASATTTDTWSNWGEAFFTTYCVECHGTKNPDGLDFTQESIVIANKDNIRCGVCVMQDPSWNCPADIPAEQFPISDSTMTNPKPSDAERDRAVAWINAGTP